MRGDDRIVATIGEIDPLEEQSARRQVRRIVSLSLDPTSEMMGIDAADSGEDGPVFIPPTGPALSIPEPEAGKTATPAAKGSAKPVPHKEGWKLGGGRYILQRGDTFFGLATIYLGRGARWPELRAFQPDDWKARNPNANLIREGDVILMPKEAQDRARALGLLPNVAGFSPGKVALGVLGTVVAGVGSYFAGSNS